jgi:hypothetical protein
MKTVLVVSPHFPPINAPDMHRLRISLVHFRSFGWNPVVLAVAPEYVENLSEPLLLKTLPTDLSVYRVAALPTRFTRPFGLGNLGVRAFAFLYREGCQLIRQYGIDLVYFSTTVFTVLVLGRLWKRKFGVPYVVDMQDPWFSGHYESQPGVPKTRKYSAAMRVHRILEPWTMRKTDGLVSVSTAYIDILKNQYPQLKYIPAAVLPFGAAESDFPLVRTNQQPNNFFQSGDGLVHGVYVGRGGADMVPALRIIFRALQRGLQDRPDLFSRVQLHFVGTDYARPDRARKTVEPIASEFGLLASVKEHSARISYFEGLQLILESDFLLVPGSDDPQYTASKIFPYILARKPLLAVFHGRSSVCGILNATKAGSVIPFDPSRDINIYSTQLLDLWTAVLTCIPFEPRVNWEAFAQYSAIETARRQCEMFSAVEALSHKPIESKRGKRSTACLSDS